MAFNRPSHSSDDAPSPRSYHSTFVSAHTYDDQVSPTSAPASVFRSDAYAHADDSADEHEYALELERQYQQLSPPPPRSAAGDVSPHSQAASAFPSPRPAPAPATSRARSHSRARSARSTRTNPRNEPDVSPRSTGTRAQFSPDPQDDSDAAADLSPTSQPGSTFPRRPSIPAVPALPAGFAASAAPAPAPAPSERSLAIRNWSISTSEYSDGGDLGQQRTNRQESDAFSYYYSAQASATFSQASLVALPARPSLPAPQPSNLSAAPLMSHSAYDPHSAASSPYDADADPGPNPFEQAGNPFDSPTEPAAPRIRVDGDSLPSSPNPDAPPHHGDIGAYGTSYAGSAATAGTARAPSPARSPSDTTPFEAYAAPGTGTDADAAAPRATSSAVERSPAGSLSASAAATRRAQRVKAAPSSIRSGRSRQAGGPRPAGTGPDSKRKPFQSTRLKGEIYKPWLEKKDPAQRWARWITIVSIFIGLGAAGAICYDGYASVPSLGNTCLVLNDNFDTLDTSVWSREVRLDGYANGEFEWTTASDNNSFVEDGVLYLVPTLTADVLGADAITNGYTLNLTTDGTCTSTNVSQCAATSNSSLLTVINPVQSARLTTQHSLNVKYGRVEVRARFPTGDWLWPSITMLPVNETYGAWPRSGQIDIVTGRGNNASYPTRGVDYAQSDIHWGPTEDLDREYMTWGYREQRRTYYSEEWHTFGLEWNEDYMWTYIDTKVSQSMSLRFGKESFWNRGGFPDTITNNSVVEKLTNPWALSEANVAPFDQPFYLVIDLAVGGTSGWFPDGEGGKPWLDDSVSAMSDFWAAKDKWWATWPEDKTKRGFAIDSVKVWKTC